MLLDLDISPSLLCDQTLWRAHLVTHTRRTVTRWRESLVLFWPTEPPQDVLLTELSQYRIETNLEREGRHFDMTSLRIVFKIA